MHEEEKDGVDMWLWLKVKYESAAISDPLRIYYADKIRSLKLGANGSLHNYIDRFQGLVIQWRAINMTVHPEYRLVTQMVEQIEDSISSVPCESINNWVEIKKTFRNAAATLRAHKMGKLSG